MGVKPKKPNLSQWKRKGGEMLWWLGEHAFWFTMILILVAGLLAGLTFYQYILSAPREIPRDEESGLGFNEALFQRVLEAQDQRAQAKIQMQDLTPRDIFTP